MTKPACLLPLLALAAACGPTPSRAVVARAGDRLDSVVAAEWGGDSTGGVAIGMVVGDSLVRVILRGRADMESGRPVTADTRFRIGSITKQFTALMYLQLVQQGKVSPATTVESLVPEAQVLRRRFPDAAPITLFQLATHTSGMAREPGDDTLDDGPSARWDTLVVKALDRTGILFEPGTRRQYSNIGYALLGLALARAAGEPYESYVERRILRPLRMMSTGFSPDEPALAAEGYELRSGVLQADVPARERTGRGYKIPNGGLYSTLADLARFLAFQNGLGPDSVLPRTVLDSNYARMVYVNRKMTEAAGLGFVLLRDDGVVFHGHAGNVAGFEAYNGFDRERKVGVIVLRNVSPSGFDSYKVLVAGLRALARTD